MKSEKLMRREGKGLEGFQVVLKEFYQGFFYDGFELKSKFWTEILISLKIHFIIVKLLFIFFVNEPKSSKILLKLPHNLHFFFSRY